MGPPPPPVSSAPTSTTIIKTRISRRSNDFSHRFIILKVCITYLMSFGFLSKSEFNILIRISYLSLCWWYIFLFSRFLIKSSIVPSSINWKSSTLIYANTVFPDSILSLSKCSFGGDDCFHFVGGLIEI